MAGKHREKQPNRRGANPAKYAGVSAWLGAGAVGLGIGAAVACGAGVAHADTSEESASSSRTSANDLDARSNERTEAHKTSRAVSDSDDSIETSTAASDLENDSSPSARNSKPSDDSDETAKIGETDEDTSNAGALDSEVSAPARPQSVFQDNASVDKWSASRSAEIPAPIEASGGGLEIVAVPSLIAAQPHSTFGLDGTAKSDGKIDEATGTTTSRPADASTYQLAAVVEGHPIGVPVQEIFNTPGVYPDIETAVQSSGNPYFNGYPGDLPGTDWTTAVPLKIVPTLRYDQQGFPIFINQSNPTIAVNGGVITLRTYIGFTHELYANEIPYGSPLSTGIYIYEVREWVVGEEFNRAELIETLPPGVRPFTFIHLAPGTVLPEGVSGGPEKPKSDLDGDGIPDDEDPDADGDGVSYDLDPDDFDAEVPGATDPDPDPVTDSDGDGVGSDLDPDDHDPSVPGHTDPEPGTDPPTEPGTDPPTEPDPGNEEEDLNPPKERLWEAAMDIGNLIPGINVYVAVSKLFVDVVELQEAKTLAGIEEEWDDIIGDLAGLVPGGKWFMKIPGVKRLVTRLVNPFKNFFISLIRRTRPAATTATTRSLGVDAGAAECDRVPQCVLSSA